MLDVALANYSIPKVFTSSQVYETIGASHDTQSRGIVGLTSSRDEIVGMLNQMLQADDEHDITLDQMCALHRVVVSGTCGGMIRDHAAVGYATSRIYRVFMPATELREGLAHVFKTLEREPSQAKSKCKAYPLLRAYYLYAALVFYIHPFIDGNGRIARLLGNLIALKHGFPALFRSSDKTLQLDEYLHRAVITIEVANNSKRQNRRNRTHVGRKENVSMWF